MNYKDKLLYNYLVDRAIGCIALVLIIFCITIIIGNYPDPFVANVNITNPYLGLFFTCCLGYGFIEITGRLIACATFGIYKLITFIYYKNVRHNEVKNCKKEG